MRTMDLGPFLQDNGSKIVLFVWDGVGGITSGPDGRTELQAADTPNADRLAAEGCLGRLEPVYPGVTPGSGPGHLGLFGYDPIEYVCGRGALAAAGVGFDLADGDVAARLNFCTLDSGGNVTDRRAGRIPSEESAPIVEKLAREIDEVDGVKVFFELVKEHRALLVLRGEHLGDGVHDTDPQATGVPPHEPTVIEDTPANRRTAEIAAKVIARAREVLSGEEKANGILARGFAEKPKWPSMAERFGVRAAVVAGTPMYRGVAKLVGMDPLEADNDADHDVQTVADHWDAYDFFFLHYKHTDKAGEDGAFDTKAKYIAEADGALPKLLELEPDVLAITADHSTPSAFAAHSFHPVPLLLSAETVRRDPAEAFDEIACIGGELGLRPSTHLMPLMLGHAGRLAKFGA